MFSTESQCPYVPRIYTQCSVGLEIISQSAWDRLSSVLEGGLHGFVLWWLLPIQPWDHVSPHTVVKKMPVSYQAISF